MRAKPGEIWLADLGLAAKTRPILIVSRDDADPPRMLLLYVPLTRRLERFLGNLSPELFAKVREALRFALEL